MKKSSMSIFGLALFVCFFAGTQLTTKNSEKETNREIANSPKIDEKMINTDFKSFAKAFKPINSTEKLHSFITNLDQNYENASDSVKLMTLHLNILPLFRGVTYAVHDIVDSNTALRSQSMTIMRDIAKVVSINKTIPQWDTLYDYITRPAVDNNGKITHQFKNESELQGYLCGPIYNKLEENSKKMKELYENNSKLIVLDNKLIQGESSFKDNIGRFNAIDKPELKFMQYSLESALYQLSFSCIYSIKGTHKVLKKIGASFGADVFKIFTRPDGISTERKVKIIKSVSGFLTKRADGNTWARKAWSHLQASTDTLDELSKLLLDYEHTEHSIYRREHITPYESQIVDTLEKSKTIFSRTPATLRSSVTGHVVKVNVKKFFDNPEKDLRLLLPTKFEGGSEEISIKLNGKKIKYENYKKGMPIGWNKEVLSKYMDVQGEYSGEMFLEALRISKSSWEGLGFASLLGFSLI